MPTLKRQLEVTDSHGLHLRMASRFVEVVQHFQAQVRVHCEGRVADGKSILDMMMLATVSGARLDVEVNGPDAAEAADALSELLETQSDKNGRMDAWRNRND